jgi:hypothetical protein
MARLHLYRNGKRIKTLDLGKQVYIVGREKICDLVLGDAPASRQHFRLMPEGDGQFLIEDLGSSNGTFINGRREYRISLTEQAYIQVGKALMIFEPGGENAAPEVIPELPAWALTTREMDALPPPAQTEEAATRPVAPAVLRRVQAEALARTRPHLLLRAGNERRVLPLDSTVTQVGLGPLKASLGAAPKSKILAEVTREGEDAYSIRAKGFFSKIQVNGESTARAVLTSGDALVIAGVELSFHLGLDED